MTVGAHWDNQCSSALALWAKSCIEWGVANGNSNSMQLLKMVPNQHFVQEINTLDSKLHPMGCIEWEFPFDATPIRCNFHSLQHPASLTAEADGMHHPGLEGCVPLWLPAGWGGELAPSCRRLGS